MFSSSFDKSISGFLVKFKYLRSWQSFRKILCDKLLYLVQKTTMLILPLFLATISLSLFLLLNVRNWTKRTVRRPPGPPGLPIVGNLNLFDQPAPHISLQQLSKSYGPIMFLQLGLVPTIVVSSAEVAKQVMKTHDHIFCSRPSLAGQRKLSYNGLDLAFAPYNEYWREMRRICIVHLFSTKMVQSFASVREEEVSKMIRKISKLSEKPVNLSEIVFSLTCSVISKIAFGKRYDDEECERSRFQTLFNEAQALMVGFYVSDYFPLMSWVDKVRGISARLDKTFLELDACYQKIIDEHLEPAERPKSNSDKDEDIIDVLLRLRKERSTGIDLTLDHIKAVLMIIFIAGTDTASTVVVWAMTELIKNPEAMVKVQEEIRVLGPVKEDNLQKFVYLRAVIKETFRLHPPAPLLVPRETLQKCTIQGYEIQPKTRVFVNAYAISRDPDTWEYPEEFTPERFLGNPIDFRGQHFELIPFGAGRRICPGMHLGLATIELALASLLYSFDWEVPAGLQEDVRDEDVIPGITMHKKKALRVLARDRCF